MFLTYYPVPETFHWESGNLGYLLWLEFIQRAWVPQYEKSITRLVKIIIPFLNISPY